MLLHPHATNLICPTPLLRLIEHVGAGRQPAPPDLADMVREVATYDRRHDRLGYGTCDGACLSQCPTIYPCLLCIDQRHASTIGHTTRSWLIGAHRVPFTIGSFARPVLRGVAIQLYPTALPILFDLSAAELINQAIAVDQLPALDGRILDERLAETADTATRITIALNFLRERQNRRRTSSIRQHEHDLEAIGVIEHHGATTDLHQLRRHFGWSERHLRRRFTSFCGWSPKSFIRLQRLTALIDAIIADTPIDWSHFACDHGYSDQAHMIRECRSFLGSTPSALHRRTANRYALGVGHVHVPGTWETGSMVGA